jgi:hypothetical protein
MRWMTIVPSELSALETGMLLRNYAKQQNNQNKYKRATAYPT